jgi:hypothetical protein
MAVVIEDEAEFLEALHKVSIHIHKGQKYYDYAMMYLTQTNYVPPVHDMHNVRNQEYCLKQVHRMSDTLKQQYILRTAFFDKYDVFIHPCSLFEPYIYDTITDEMIIHQMNLQFIEIIDIMQESFFKKLILTLDLDDSPDNVINYIERLPSLIRFYRRCLYLYLSLPDVFTVLQHEPLKYEHLDLTQTTEPRVRQIKSSINDLMDDKIKMLSLCNIQSTNISNRPQIKWLTKLP